MLNLLYEDAAPPETLDEAVIRRLARFLPASLVEAIDPEEPNLVAIKDAIQYLESLHYTIGTYLPDHLRDPGATFEGGNLLEGSLLFADVSGFTALFEKLSMFGEEGAELLTEKMNAYFFTMLEVLSRSNGILMKFAGDALLAFFPRPEPKSRNLLAGLLGQENESSGSDEGVPEDIFWAIRAGLRMQRRMGAFADFEIKGISGNALTMSVGISTGRLFTVHVGTDAQRDYMILGDMTAHAMNAESAGQAGEVLIDQRVYDQLDDTFRTAEVAPDMHRIEDDLGDALGDFESTRPTRRRGSRYTTIDSNPAADLKSILQRVETIAAFLPLDLQKLLFESGERRAIGSLYRPQTAVIFAYVAGIAELLAIWGEDELPRIAEMLDRYYVAIQHAVARYGGSLMRTDPYKSGNKLLATFGAPIKHYADAERAILAAEAMHKALDRLNAELYEVCPPPLREQFHAAPNAPDTFLQHRIGVTLGDVLGAEVGVGQTGRGTRREYTVMGDDVNLAARLMSKATMGTTLANDTIWQAIQYRFEGEVLDPIYVKGKREPIHVVVVSGEKSQIDPTLHTRTSFIDREDEIKAIREAVDNMLKDTDTGQIIGIWGDMGMGKSRLLHEVAIQLNAMPLLPLTLVHVACVPYTTDSRPWDNVVRQCLELQRVPADKRAQRLAAQMQKMEMEDELPTVARLVGLDEAAPLPPDAALAETIVRLLCAVARSRAMLFLIDDIHYATPLSWEITDKLCAAVHEVPLVYVAALQPDLLEGDLCQPFDSMIKLEDLSKANTLTLVAKLLGVNTLSDSLNTLVWEQTRGRPLFIEALVAELQAKGWLHIDESQHHAHLVENVEANILPSITRSMVLSRIDRLPVAPREALLAASVLGEKFKADMLTSIHEADDQADIDALCEEGLLFRNKLIRDQYHFTHKLTQMVAYHSLPHSRRQALHDQAGDYWASVVETLSLMQLTERAYHHVRGGHVVKAVESLRLARDRAHSHGANEQAIAFSNQILELTRERAELFDVYREAAENLGDLYAEQESYADAAQAYEPAVKSAYGSYLSVLCRQALVTLASDPIVAAMSLTRALTVADKAAPVRPWLQAGLAWLLWQRGAYDAASEYCRYDAGGPEAQTDDATAALLDYVYGLVARSLGREEAANAHLQGAREAWEEQGYKEGVELVEHAQGEESTAEQDEALFLRVMLTLYFQVHGRGGEEG